MYAEDIFRLALNGILHRKLRSWLTILGIIIGVAAVIALVSVGQGLQESVASQLSGLGASTISVSPGRERASEGHAMFGGGGGFMGFGRGGGATATLTESDVRIVKATPGVQYASGMVSGRASIGFAGRNASASIEGVEPGLWELIQPTDLASGRYLRSGDINGVVIGDAVANSIFPKPVTLNSQLTVGGKPFRVVGVLKPTGGFVGGVSDNIVVMTKAAARGVLGSDIGTTQVTSILAKAADTADPGAVASQMESELKLSRRVTNQTQDFSVNSAQTIQARVQTVTSSITLFLGGIAGISLLVGGVGVANTMFTSVLERTRHIGVLKSVGMTSFEVMGMFLTESALMGLIGGVIGTIIGFLISQAMSAFGLGAGIPLQGAGARRGTLTYVSPELVIFAVGFSVVIGIVSGLLPARSAAKLQPVEALRYE